MLSDWISQGHEIIVVTGRPPEAYEASLEWLRTNEVPFSSLVIVDKYLRERVNMSTAISMERVCDMGFCFAVENSSVIAEYIAARTGIPVALFDRPWNQNGPLARKIRRCYSWVDIGRIEIDRLPRTVKGE